MTRWRRSATRRPNAAGSARTGRAAAHAKSTATVVVDEYDGLILLRASAEASPRPDGVAELARFLTADEAVHHVFTVVVGVDGAGAELWTRLVTVLDSLRERGVGTIRLALSGAGGERADRPAMAQRIADAWGIEVIAPDAGVVIVPGGSLFALGTDVPEPGWRLFRPGTEPKPLGPRSPAPLWQPALDRLPGHTARDWVVEQVPAGILVRPAGAPKARAGDLCYAVPVDADHPTVLVGGSESRGDADIPAEDLAALLAALPDTTRSAIRLAPCGSVDLLPVGQDTAEILGAEVEVLTGLPLVVGTSAEPKIRPVLIGADAEPTWVPFVEAVACRPYGADGTDRVPAPRLVRWRSPMDGTGRTGPGAVPLSDRWQVSVTRAGMVVGPRGEAPALDGRPVSPEQMAIEVNLRGAPADDALFADLSRVLSELGTGAREFVTLHRILPTHYSDDEDFRLLRLAIEHGVSLAEPPPAETPPVPAAPNVRTVAIPRARPSAETTGAPSTRSPAERAGSAESATERSTGPAAEKGTASVTGSPAATSPGAERSRYAPAPSSPPEPAPPTPPTPPASAAETRSRAVPARPSQDGGTKPLPPNLGRIPLTPVTPREPVPPVPPGGPLEPESPATQADRASAPAPSKPTTHAESSSPSAAAKGAGSAAAAAEPSSKTSSGPITPPPSPAVARRDPPAARVSRPRPPAKPLRRSTEAERTEFRSLAQPVWERHSASVNRAMTRMPALRGAQMDAARTDLVAVHIYLSGGVEELSDRGPDGAGLPGCYLACLGSGLGRLPSYRGVAVRGGLTADGGLERFVPGRVLREPGPVSALPIGAAAGLPAAAGGYIIWSTTGRRVRPLLDAVPGPASDEVVFPPGAGFRVLDVRSAGLEPFVLLSEVRGAGPEIDDRPGTLDDVDRVALERLEEALRRPTSSPRGMSPGTWPARCTEPLDEEMGRDDASSVPGEPPAPSAI